MTLFREEFNITFACLFAVLLLVKVFHWLSQERVDYVCHLIPHLADCIVDRADASVGINNASTYRDIVNDTFCG